MSPDLTMDDILGTSQKQEFWEAMQVVSFVQGFDYIPLNKRPLYWWIKLEYDMPFELVRPKKSEHSGIPQSVSNALQKNSDQEDQILEHLKKSIYR